MDERARIIREELGGIYNTTISEGKGEIRVYTMHTFTSVNRLVEIMTKVCAKDIEVDFKYNRNDGVVFIFKF